MAFTVPSYDLKDKVAIITGSTRGIGNAIAHTMAAYGAAVVITGRKQEQCDAVAAEIEAAGGKALGVATDVTNAAARENLIAKTVEKFGHLDILVNNAGVLDGQLPIHETTPEVYDMIYETNQRAVFLCCQRAIRIFLEQGTPANIVNVASAASLRGLKGGAMYVTTKHAVLGLTRNISASFFERGIRCNCIEPANILTEINKVPREKGIGILEWQMRAGKAAPLHTITKPGEKKPILGKPKDCANAIAYLADDVAARYISGAELKVDAGWLNM